MSNSIVKKIRSGSEIERFHQSYVAVPFPGCWIWERSIDDDGYGIHYFGGRKTFAHRRSYEIYKGVIAAGLHVCHTCDVPACVNPNHLFVGTCKENLHDAMRKGRIFYGQKNGRAKLTPEQVAIVLSSDRTGADLAREFGVSKPTINRIRRGEGWKNAA